MFDLIKKKNINFSAFDKKFQLNEKLAVKPNRTIFIPSEKFKQYFFSTAKSILIKRNLQGDFLITNHNIDLINLLYFHLIGSEKFLTYSDTAFEETKNIDRKGFFRKNSNRKKNIHAGIGLIGKYGVGKTLILETYVRMRGIIFDKKVISARSTEITKIIEERGYNYFFNTIVMIDDIGKEPRLKKNYGNESKPIAELIDRRYIYGEETYYTSNYTTETLKQHYGHSIVDRFFEMFNIFELSGKTREENKTK